MSWFSALNPMRWRRAVGELVRRDDELEHPEVKKKDKETKEQTAEREALELKTLETNLRRSSRFNEIESAMAMKVYETYASLRRLYLALDSYQDYYLVDEIVHTLSDEMLSPDPITNEIFSIRVKEGAKNQQKIEKRIKRLLELFDLEEIVADIVPEALFWGDYSLKVVTDPKEGVIDILDTLQPLSVVSVHRKKLPSIVLEDRGNEIVIKEPTEFWTISTSIRKIMIGNDMGMARVPYHLRSGRPMFSTLLPQIRDLMSLEIVDVAKEMADLNRNSLVNVDAPAGLDLKKQQVWIDYYEQRINRSVEDTSSMSPQDIEQAVRLAGQIKVILRDPNRGGIDPIVLNTNASADNRLQKIRDKRESITTANGVPYEVIYGQTDANARSGIRQYARLQKRVMKGQKAVAMSIRHLIAIDCGIADVEIASWRDIEVDFVNAIDSAQIQTIEALDIKLDMIERMMALVEALKESEIFGPEVQLPEAIQLVQSLMGSIKGGAEMFRQAEEGTERAAKEKGKDPEDRGPKDDDDEDPALEEDPEKDTVKEAKTIRGKLAEQFYARRENARNNNSNSGRGLGTRSRRGSLRRDGSSSVHEGAKGSENPGGDDKGNPVSEDALPVSE